jgi:hypothetical protein
MSGSLDLWHFHWCQEGHTPEESRCCLYHLILRTKRTWNVSKASAKQQLVLGPSVHLLSTECTANGMSEEASWAHDLVVSNDRSIAAMQLYPRVSTYLGVFLFLPAAMTVSGKTCCILSRSELSELW